MAFRKFDLTKAECKKLFIIFIVILGAGMLITVIGGMLMGVASLFSARAIIETIAIILLLTGLGVMGVPTVFLSIKYPGFFKPYNSTVEQIERLEKLYESQDITEAEYTKLRTEVEKTAQIEKLYLNSEITKQEYDKLQNQANKQGKEKE
ncbi:MAG: hypothetical protein FWE53_04170 [Firmicutes bacterium]|nr:hypothetical protein [Bacillota bacterium]